MDFTPKPHIRDTADGADASRWSQTYSARHRPILVIELPAGIEPPKKVRIYRRANHYVLQWWDRAQKKTLSQRIDGDLVETIVRAREIDARIANYRSSGQPASRPNHQRLVGAYLDDLTKRADAGEIDPRTVERYRAPLQLHYLPFVTQPDVARRYRHVTDIDRNFQLEFARFLQSRHVAANGRSGGPTRPMRGQQYVLEVVRSMLHWAADGVRGNLLPAGFQNPFRRSNGAGSRSGGKVLSEPDVTMEMAIELLSACDAFQLPIFSTLALCGVRPDELGWIFWEDIHGGWVRVIGHPDLSYQTKGRRDKQFPLLEPLRAVWPVPSQATQGLLFQRRAPEIRSSSLTSKHSLVETFRHRCQNELRFSAAVQRRLRDEVLSRAGQLTYDHVEAEFGKLARQLRWPKSATLKDFRHLFATSLENDGVPESYRRFLMGHSPGRAAIVTYTHLNKLREHYLRAVDSEFKPLVNAIEGRAREFRLRNSGQP